LYNNRPHTRLHKPIAAPSQDRLRTGGLLLRGGFDTLGANANLTADYASFWTKVRTRCVILVKEGQMFGYRLLDIGFFVFHSSLILFILFGWTWRKTRRWNLLVVTLTAASWFGLGIWYGFGYCPCTDWHWRVRLALGDTDLPFSYIKFLIDRVLGSDVSAYWVDVVTVSGFAAAAVASIATNVLDYRRPRDERSL